MTRCSRYVTLPLSLPVVYVILPLPFCFTFYTTLRCLADPTFVTTFTFTPLRCYVVHFIVCPRCPTAVYVVVTLFFASPQFLISFSSYILSSHLVCFRLFVVVVPVAPPLHTRVRSLLFARCRFALRTRFAVAPGSVAGCGLPHVAFTFAFYVCLRCYVTVLPFILTLQFVAFTLLVAVVVHLYLQFLALLWLPFAFVLFVFAFVFGCCVLLIPVYLLVTLYVLFGYVCSFTFTFAAFAFTHLLPVTRTRLQFTTFAFVPLPCSSLLPPFYLRCYLQLPFGCCVVVICPALPLPRYLGYTFYPFYTPLRFGCWFFCTFTFTQFSSIYYVTFCLLLLLFTFTYLYTPLFCSYVLFYFYICWLVALQIFTFTFCVYYTLQLVVIYTPYLYPVDSICSYVLPFTLRCLVTLQLYPLLPLYLFPLLHLLQLYSYLVGYLYLCSSCLYTFLLPYPQFSYLHTFTFILVTFCCCFVVYLVTYVCVFVVYLRLLQLVYRCSCSTYLLRFSCLCVIRSSWFGWITVGLRCLIYVPVYLRFDSTFVSFVAVYHLILFYVLFCCCCICCFAVIYFILFDFVILVELGYILLFCICYVYYLCWLIYI